MWRRCSSCPKADVHVIEPIRAGNMNLIYLVEVDGRRYVYRAPRARNGQHHRSQKRGTLAAGGWRDRCRQHVHLPAPHRRMEAVPLHRRRSCPGLSQQKGRPGSHGASATAAYVRRRHRGHSRPSRGHAQAGRAFEPRVARPFLGLRRDVQHSRHARPRGKKAWTQRSALSQ